MTTNERFTEQQLSQVRCCVNHSGNHTLAAASGNTVAECAGCGSFYTAEQILDAIRERKQKQIGQGGVGIR